MLILLFVIPASSQSQPVLSGLVSEAQCRAGCLAQWSEEVQEREECWAVCASLEQCEGQDCGPGCRTACSLLGNRTGRTGRDRDLNTYTFSSLPVMAGCDLSWGPIQQSTNNMKTSTPSSSSSSTSSSSTSNINIGVRPGQTVVQVEVEI